MNFAEYLRSFYSHRTALGSTAIDLAVLQHSNFSCLYKFEAGTKKECAVIDSLFRVEKTAIAARENYYSHKAVKHRKRAKLNVKHNP